MAEIIEKTELPIIITKIKIGKKDLTKNMLSQVPFGMYLYHKNYLDKEKQCYGFPIESHRKSTDYDIDTKQEYTTDGTLLGFIRLSVWSQDEIKRWIRGYNDNYWGKHSDSLENYKGKFYFIVWYDKNNRLKKGYIDRWSLDQLGIDIESMQIFI